MIRGEPDPGATPVAGYFTCTGEGDAAEESWTRLPICWPHLIDRSPEVAEKGSHVYENEDGAESAPVIFEPIGRDDG